VIAAATDEWRVMVTVAVRLLDRRDGVAATWSAVVGLNVARIWRDWLA